MKRPSPPGFTLIELLTVIAIIAILMALLFPALKGVQEQAKRAQAKTTIVSIITAARGYYTEYGKQPIPNGDGTSDKTYLYSDTSIAQLYNILRSKDGDGNSSYVNNPRQIVFLQGKDARNFTTPKTATDGFANDGVLYDPWGYSYEVILDGDYDGMIANPYGSNNAGASTLQQDVIALSIGKDGKLNTDYKGSDDVISWQ